MTSGLLARTMYYYDQRRVVTNQHICLSKKFNRVFRHLFVKMQELCESPRDTKDSLRSKELIENT